MFTKLIGCCLGAILLAYGGVEVWLGALSYETGLKQRFCAAWLCPEEFWEARTFIMLQQSAGGAAALFLPQFQRALKNDAASAYAWANLAEVERDAGRFELAQYCFGRALAAGSRNPAILFRAANYAFLRGDSAGAMRDLYGILRNPELTVYYEPVFLTYSRLGAPIQEVLEKGVPPLETAAEPFLEFWMDGGQVAEAKATWNWMVEHSLTSDQAAGKYVSFLVSKDEIEAATQEWRRANPKSPNYQVVNWIFNGGFETEPKPGPFDWHIETTPDVEATRVQDLSRDGQWSVKLSFNGQSNVDYHGVYQETVIHPGQWRLQAFLKLDGVTTDQGVSIRVYDPAQPARLDVHTDPKSGAASWSEVERAFVAGPETKLVRVEVMRAASLRFDSKIAGQAWVDSLALTPIH